MKKTVKYILYAGLLSALFIAGEGVVRATDYYARVNTNPSPSSAGTAYVSAGSSGVSGTNTTADDHDSSSGSSVNITFSIKATENTGYRFTGWTCTGGTIESPSNRETTIVVKATSESSSNPTTANATANFAQNIYYAALSVQSGGNGTASLTSASPISTLTPGGQVEFTISATASSGYHFKKWTVTSGSGSFDNEYSTSTKFHATASSTYDGTNSYVVTATFEQDKFNAKLSTSTSSALEGTSSGSAQVKDGSNWASTATKTINNPNTNIAFEVKATANKGYQFKGWSASNGSTSYISGLGATGTYNVTSASSEGGTNEKSIYAVFDKGTYTVHYDKNAPSGCTVEGSQMSDGTFTSFVAKALADRTYNCWFVITYDTQGGSACTETKADRFDNWIVNGESTTYTNQQSITRTENHGATVTLKANWASSRNMNLASAPTKTKFGIAQTFLGWYDAASGGTKLGDAGATVSVSSSRTVYARWKMYNITINVGAGSGASGKAVFNVVRTGSPEIRYRITVPIGGSMTLKDIPSGEYTVTPESAWNWDKTITPASTTQSFSTSGEESQTLTFDFSASAKTGTKKHAEESMTKSY